MQIGSSADNSPMIQVQEGMRVVDAAGEEIGKVEYVQMGDPGAVTVQGNDPRPSDLLGEIAERVLPEQVEPDVPEPLRTSLRRTGYLKMSGHGLGAKDRYVSSERVSSVTDQTVRLSVGKDQLATEH